MTPQQSNEVRHAVTHGPVTNDGCACFSSSCAVDAEAVKSRSVPRRVCPSSPELPCGVNCTNYQCECLGGGPLADPASASQECAKANYGAGFTPTFVLWFLNLIWFLVPLSWRRDKSLEKSEGSARAENDLFKPFKSPLVHPKCGSCHIALTELRCYHERRLRSKDFGYDPVQHASHDVDHVKHGPSHMLNPCSSTARSFGLSPPGFANQLIQLLDRPDLGGYLLIPSKNPQNNDQFRCEQSMSVNGSGLQTQIVTNA